MAPPTYFEQISVEAAKAAVADYESRTEGRKEGGINVARSVTGPARVLIIDPDQDTRSLYREWFQPSGCDIVEASDGREALTKALMRRPTIVVTELTLPFLDGYALCEILRRDHVTSDVPILVITAETRAAELTRIKVAGASAVLVKPTTVEQMWVEAQQLMADTHGGRRLGATASEPKL